MPKLLGLRLEAAHSQPRPPTQPLLTPVPKHDSEHSSEPRAPASKPAPEPQATPHPL